MINIIVLLALAAVMKQWGSPPIMAGLYTLFGVAISLAGGGVSAASMLVGGIIWFIVAFVYFFVLLKLEHSGWYWPVSLIGAILVNFI